MPLTKNGWLRGLEPLRFSVKHFHNHVLFSITNTDGVKVAMELHRKHADFVALVGRQEVERPPIVDAEFDVDGKLFVSDSPVEASCEAAVETWEGRPVPLRMQMEQQPRCILWSVRDPENQVGFILKLTETARGTVFAAIAPNSEFRSNAQCTIEGDLEITQ